MGWVLAGVAAHEDVLKGLPSFSFWYGLIVFRRLWWRKKPMMLRATTRGVEARDNKETLAVMIDRFTSPVLALAPFLSFIIMSHDYNCPDLI